MGPTQVDTDVPGRRSCGNVGAPQLSQPRGTPARSRLQMWLPALTVGAGPGSREVASGRDLEEEQPGTEAAAQGKGQLSVF